MGSRFVGFLLAILFGVGIASAQQTKQDLTTFNNMYINTNGVGGITGANLNTELNQIITTLCGLGQAADCPLSISWLLGTMLASQFPALTGDVTSVAGSFVTTLATVNANPGSYGSLMSIPAFTVDAKGRLTASATVSPGALATAINVADVAGGGCNGTDPHDTNALNAASAQARLSTAFVNHQPIKITYGYWAQQIKCYVSSWNLTGFGGGAHLNDGSAIIVSDIAIEGFGAGNITVDALGSNQVFTNDLSITTDPASPPMIGFQEGEYQSAHITACCLNRHERDQVIGNFTLAAWKNAGAEATAYRSVIAVNNGSATVGVIGSLAVTGGGTGCTSNGTFTHVALGAGSVSGSTGATAIFVVAGNVVTAAYSDIQGVQYNAADTLTSAIFDGCTAVSLSVGDVAQYGLVMDGQNHDFLSSKYATVTWPADTYYTFTEVLVDHGQFSYSGPSNHGTGLWIASMVGAKFDRAYFTNRNGGDCVQLYNNQASGSEGNTNLYFDLECEPEGLTDDIHLYGTGPAPPTNGLWLRDTLLSSNQAIFNFDPVTITAPIMHNLTLIVPFMAFNPSPVFTVGQASAWTVDGNIQLQNAKDWNWPGHFAGTVLAGGVELTKDGGIGDMIGNPTGGFLYSCAFLEVAAYAGNKLCTLTRASDSATLDIYATPGEHRPDPTPILAWCGGTTCYIGTMYDQMGNGNPATNATQADQPTVVFEPTMNNALCGNWGTIGNAVVLTASSVASNTGIFAAAGGGFATAVTYRTSTYGSGLNAARIMAKSNNAAIGWDFLVVPNNLELIQRGSTQNGIFISANVVPIVQQIFDITYSNTASSGAAVPAMAWNGLSQTVNTTQLPTGTLADSASLFLGNNTAGNQGYPGELCLFAANAVNPGAVGAEAIRRMEATQFGIAAVN